MFKYGSHKYTVIRVDGKPIVTPDGYVLAVQESSHYVGRIPVEGLPF